MYRVTLGDQPAQLLHGYEDARQWLWLTLQDMKRAGRLPEWRVLALDQQIRDMPRAGMVFLVESVGFVKAELAK